ncbi:MAG: glycosyltransferase [Pseudomonadota bacterium]
MPPTDTSPPRLAALVVTFNRLSQIKATVERLRVAPCDIICVVDNGSTDGTRAWLEALDEPRLKVILSTENRGGAGGFEAGLRALMDEDDPEWVVLMDDDARPEPGCIERFLSGAMGKWDAVSAAVYRTDGEICEMNRPTINPFWDLMTFLRTSVGSVTGQGRKGFHIPDSAYDARPIEIDATSFVGLFLSRKTIARAGYPDGRLFIYGDDVLYTLGLRKAGLRIGFVPELRFEHDDRKGTLGARGHYVPTWKAYYNARNGCVVYRTAAGPMLFPVAMMAVLIKWMMAGRHYGAERGVYYRLVWHGLKDGMRGRRFRPHAEVTALARARSRI